MSGLGAPGAWCAYLGHCFKLLPTRNLRRQHPSTTLFDGKMLSVRPSRIFNLSQKLSAMAHIYTPPIVQFTILPIGCPFNKGHGTGGKTLIIKRSDNQNGDIVRDTKVASGATRSDGRAKLNLISSLKRFFAVFFNCSPHSPPTLATPSRREIQPSGKGAPDGMSSFHDHQA